jgi:hypothetical protein
MKLIYYSVIVIAMATLIFAGCLNRDKHLSLSSGKELTPITLYYSPLTSAKCANLVNGNDSFSQCNIVFSNRLSAVRQGFWLGTGNTTQSNYLSSPAIFEGALHETDTTVSPQTDRELHKDFDLTDVQPIFDYILDEDNEDYFFNNEEYDGLSIPYEKRNDKGICQGEMLILIEFFEPACFDRNWAIFKCVDEYPAEGTPLYGLFQMLENDFITQFEE